LVAVSDLNSRTVGVDPDLSAARSPDELRAILLD